MALRDGNTTIAIRSDTKLVLVGLKRRYRCRSFDDLIMDRLLGNNDDVSLKPIGDINGKIF